MKAAKQTVTVRLEKHPAIEATGIKIPLDVEAVFGSKRVPVRAVVNGAEYRGPIVRMGGEYMLGIPKTFRNAAGIKAGDNIVVTLEPDNEVRTVTVPPDLVAALKKTRHCRGRGKNSASPSGKRTPVPWKTPNSPRPGLGRLEKTLALLREKAAK